MRVKRSPITFGKLAGIWFAALTAVTVVVVIASAGGWFLGTVRAGGVPMGGEWVGMCQDGRPFVSVSLRQAVSGYSGTMSLGNVKITSQPGNPVGACTVNDPPSAEHAMKITNTVLRDGVLTFDSEHGQEYEMKRTGGDSAELRFVGTNRDESWFGLRRVK
jgi:hypothetical protein